MADDLPDEFDLIVVGTGFPESCIAAAASRVGKTVLHVDENEFYGGAWTSFNLEGLNAFLQKTNTKEVLNASYQWHNKPQAPSGSSLETDVAAATSSTSIEWTPTRLLQETKRFNLDLCPKILYSAGQLVRLLISSNICRYAEFRAIDHVCTLFGGSILNVPCSRSDVFNTKILSIIEKRLLMKFLTLCMTYGEDKCEEAIALHRHKTFQEYLQGQKVTDKIRTCIVQAIAMCTAETGLEDGIMRTKKFLDSLGHYGNTPFLFPMYGSGELPQCFCRLSAVFGGVYCLNRRIDGVTIDADTNTVTVMMGGKAIRAKHFVCSHGNVPRNLIYEGIDGTDTLTNHLSRGIFITDTPYGSEALNSGGGGVNLLRLLAGTREAIMIQLSHCSGTCPKGVYVFHITTPALSNQPAADLQPFMTQVFNDEPTAPQLLYSAYFTITRRTNDVKVDTSFPVYCTAAPYYELDYDQSIENARDIFAKLYPQEPFLPRAPDPDEIIVDGEDPRALSANSLPDDLRQQLQELERSTEGMEIEDYVLENNASPPMDDE